MWIQTGRCQNRRSTWTCQTIDDFAQPCDFGSELLDCCLCCSLTASTQLKLRHQQPLIVLVLRRLTSSRLTLKSQFILQRPNLAFKQFNRLALCCSGAVCVNVDIRLRCITIVVTGTAAG